jgi:hypothetical protein
MRLDLLPLSKRRAPAAKAGIENICRESALQSASLMKWFCMIVAAALPCLILSAPTACAQKANPVVRPKPAVPPAPIVYSARTACRLVRNLLPLADELESSRSVWKVGEISLTPAGFNVSVSESRVIFMKYSDSPGVKPYGKGNSYKIDFFPGRDFLVQRGFVLDFHEKSAAEIELPVLVDALNFLITSARHGDGVDCKAALDDQAQLDAFAQLTASWRKMYVKPLLPDAVNKDRLLAEDAVAHKDMSVALENYLAGVDTDPSWAQGWFSAALLYAEQQDYDDAVFSMKHYLILLPDGPDAATAKDKLSLWTAKEHEAPAATEGRVAK